MAFSENLQYIRAQAGITQEQLAEQLEVSRQSVSKWESAASFREMDTLLRICDLYNMNLDTLLRGSAEESNISDTAQYDSFMNRFARRISFSVGAIIAAVAVLMILNILGVHEMLSAAFLLLVITISVVIMVASGLQEDAFRKKHPVIADFYTEEEKDAFHQKFVWYIAGGVGAILFGVVLMFLSFTFLPEREPYESLIGALFMLLIAASVTAFVYAGMQEDKYKIWKYNRDNNPTPEAKKRLNLIGTVCGIIMLITTAIYVTLGFTRGSWATSWWVFPVGGILCGVASVALNPYKDDDD